MIWLLTGCKLSKENLGRRRKTHVLSSRKDYCLTMRNGYLTCSSTRSTAFARNSIATGVILLAAALSSPAIFAADVYSFALIGDQPYIPTVTISGVAHQSYPAPKYINLINDINADASVRFTVHIGDIKAGNTVCEDAVYS